MEIGILSVPCCVPQWLSSRAANSFLDSGRNSGYVQPWTENEINIFFFFFLLPKADFPFHLIPPPDLYFRWADWLFYFKNITNVSKLVFICYLFKKHFWQVYGAFMILSMAILSVWCTAPLAKRRTLFSEVSSYKYIWPVLGECRSSWVCLLLKSYISRCFLCSLRPQCCL